MYHLIDIHLDRLKEEELR